MEPYQISLICVTCLLAVILIALFVSFIRNKLNLKYTEIVLNNSERLKKLEELNNSYTFYPIKPTYSYTQSYKSKAAYEKPFIEDIFKAVLSESVEDFEILLQKTQYNAKKFKRYCEEFDSIYIISKDSKFYDGLKIKPKTFIKIEEKFLSKNKLQPVTDFNIKIKKAYTSPKGQNHYQTELVFNYASTRYYLDIVKIEQKKIQRYKQSKEYQRALMSDSLRYDVMKRDSFRCCICGATASDGATLHIDHVIPVSKGGKTELNNLRTLCDRCNLGKRDKYDPVGLN